MRRSSVHFALPLVLVLSLLAACGSVRDYRFDKVSDTTPLLRIKRIHAGAGSTKVTFRYQAAAIPRRIGVHPPGHDGAFVITDAGETRTYKLKRIDGIATLPDRTPVGSNEALEFTLTFEPIPASLDKIHVGEGRYSPEAGETSWHFLDIVLK